MAARGLTEPTIIIKTSLSQDTDDTRDLPIDFTLNRHFLALQAPDKAHLGLKMGEICITWRLEV